jgi:hypothetical protein
VYIMLSFSFSNPVNSWFVACPWLSFLLDTVSAASTATAIQPGIAGDQAMGASRT